MDSLSRTLARSLTPALSSPSRTKEHTAGKTPSDSPLCAREGTFASAFAPFPKAKAVQAAADGQPLPHAGETVHPRPLFPFPDKNTRSGEHRRIALLRAREDAFTSSCPPSQGKKSHRRPTTGRPPPGLTRSLIPPFFLLPDKEERCRENADGQAHPSSKGHSSSARSPFPPGKRATREKPSSPLPLSRAQKAPGHERAGGKFSKRLAR